MVTGTTFSANRPRPSKLANLLENFIYVLAFFLPNIIKNEVGFVIMKSIILLTEPCRTLSKSTFASSCGQQMKCRSEIYLLKSYVFEPRVKELRNK